VKQTRLTPKEKIMSRNLAYAVVAISCFLVACIALEANASLTLTTGLGTSQAGNLVTNGSFENGTSVPTPGFGGKLYWATGTTNSPFGVPAGWTTSGGPNNYALWGNDGSAPQGNNGSDAIPDGQFALYFGNGGPTFVNQAPTFNANGTVGFSSTPTITPPAFYTPQVILQQTVPTNTNPSPYYRFAFWASGEDASPTPPSNPFGERGIFGLRVTNVLPGDPMQWLSVPNGGANPLGLSYLYEYTFVPLNASLPVTIEFHNFGHFDLSSYGMANFTTELVLDDVRINLAPEPASAAMLIIGAAAALSRGRRSYL